VHRIGDEAQDTARVEQLEAPSRHLFVAFH
jgi:hypothetical protein